MLDEIAEAVAHKVSLTEFKIRLLMTNLSGYDAVATKALMSLESNGHEEKLFVKISNSEKLSYLLRNEADSLTDCNKSGIREVPQVVACGSIDGRYYIAQKFVDGRTMHGRQSYLNSALAKTQYWLADLYNRTKGPPVEPEELIRRTSERARHALGVFNLEDCMDLMEKLTPRISFPTFRIHGDFWHGNILLLGEEEICITDFAFSSVGEPPIDCLDLFCDYDSGVLLDPGRLSHYTQYFPFDETAIPFLHLYSLIRKIGLKVERRRKLYDELLINDFDASLNEINEVGIAKRFVRHYLAEQPWG